MPQTSPMLQLNPSMWFGWEMIPGYLGERNVPYHSPIYVRRVTPKKTGKKILTLDFDNVFYASGVTDFSIDLRILKHAKNYIVAELLYGSESPIDRVAIISHIEFAWIERFCPHFWYTHPPSSYGAIAENSVSEYLDAVYGVKKSESR